MPLLLLPLLLFVQVDAMLQHTMLLMLLHAASVVDVAACSFCCCCRCCRRFKAKTLFSQGASLNCPGQQPREKKICTRKINLTNSSPTYLLSPLTFSVVVSREMSPSFTLAASSVLDHETVTADALHIPLSSLVTPERGGKATKAGLEFATNQLKDHNKVTVEVTSRGEPGFAKTN